MRGARLIEAPCGCTYYAEPLLAYLEFRAKGLEMPPSGFCREHTVQSFVGSPERAREILRTHMTEGDRG